VGFHRVRLRVIYTCSMHARVTSSTVQRRPERFIKTTPSGPIPTSTTDGCWRSKTEAHSAPLPRHSVPHICTRATVKALDCDWRCTASPEQCAVGMSSDTNGASAATGVDQGHPASTVIITGHRAMPKAGGCSNDGIAQRAAKLSLHAGARAEHARVCTCLCAQVRVRACVRVPGELSRHGERTAQHSAIQFTVRVLVVRHPTPASPLQIICCVCE